MRKRLTIMVEVTNEKNFNEFQSQALVSMADREGFTSKFETDNGCKVIAVSREDLFERIAQQEQQIRELRQRCYN